MGDATVGDLSLLERRKIEAAVLVPVIRAMQAEFGAERVNEVVARTIREVARAQGAAERERAAIHTTDELAGRLEDGVLREASLIVDIVEHDSERFGFNVTRCRFLEMYEELGARDLGFLLSCNRDFAFFAGLAPEMALERTETRMEGASYCDFRYRVER